MPFLVAVGAFALNGAVGGETNDDFTIPGTESQAAFDLLEDRFPAESSISTWLSPPDPRDTVRAAGRVPSAVAVSVYSAG